MPLSEFNLKSELDLKSLSMRPVLIHIYPCIYPCKIHIKNESEHKEVAIIYFRNISGKITNVLKK